MHQNFAVQFFRILLIGILLVPLISCHTSKGSTSKPGLQDPNNAFARAKIAVLNCRSWELPIYQNQKPSNSISEIGTDLCNKFDEFVIAGFSNQKYMKGASPKGVSKQLKRSGSLNLLEQIKSFEPNETTLCKTCFNSIDYYNATLGNNSDFIKLLNDFSKNCAYVDTLLLPVVISATKHQINDRGLLKFNVEAEIGIFLIDTNNGTLLWYGGKKAKVLNQAFHSDGAKLNKYPSWNLLFDRLFVKGIWIDFPGREEF